VNDNQAVAEINKKMEAFIQSIYERVIAPGSICVDGGAGTGRHTIPMARHVGNEGRVFAFEPNPATHDILKGRISEEELHNVVLEPKALSHQSGEVQFCNVVDFAAYSGLKVRDYPEENAKVEKIPVDATTLDNVDHHIDFIKLDLEGGEFQALQGGQQVLSSCRPLIVFENGRESSCRIYGYTQKSFFDFFDSLNYELYSLHGKRLIPERWSDRSLGWNFIALCANDEKRKKILRELIKEEAQAILDYFKEDQSEL